MLMLEQNTPCQGKSLKPKLLSSKAFVWHNHIMNTDVLSKLPVSLPPSGLLEEKRDFGHKDAGNSEFIGETGVLC